MTAKHDDRLELALAAMTAWSGPTPRLWERALKASKNTATSATSRWMWVYRQRYRFVQAAACLVIAGLGITIAVNISQRNQHLIQGLTDNTDWVHEWLRQDGRSSVTYQSLREGVNTLPFSAPSELSGEYSFGADAESDGVQDFVLTAPGISLGRTAGVNGSPQAVAPPIPDGGIDNQLDARAAQTRQLIRKATIELLTKDVRATFSKVPMTLNEALGEYVQESSLTGSGEDSEAEITIRVAADRLSDVMNALRELGNVQREQVIGQDVTTQAVDLEARLRNEQRVEAELLQLLEQRQDAPLKDILDLRMALGNVRSQIEQLSAQRQKLGQLVSLSTVLIIIRSDRQPRQMEFSILKYFGDNFREAWGKGLVFLADTTGGLLSILIGGLIWWIVLAIILVAIWRHRRRSAANLDK